MLTYVQFTIVSNDDLQLHYGVKSFYAHFYKLVSMSGGTANYLPSTGHYYEYVSSTGITWTNAKIAAEGRNYYGLQGDGCVGGE